MLGRDGRDIAGKAQVCSHGDSARLKIRHIQRAGELEAVDILQPQGRQVRATYAESAARRGRARVVAGGVVQHIDISRAADGHAAVAGQAHGVKAQDIGIQRQVAQHHGAVAQRAGHDGLGKHNARHTHGLLHLADHAGPGNDTVLV